MTDTQIRQLMFHRAIQAASEMNDPSSDEAQRFFLELLSTDPSKIRKLLEVEG